MNTTFAIRFREIVPEVAERAAGACFRQIAWLEDLLSRYRSGSDIAQINHLTEGASLFVNEATHRCLLRSIEASRCTGTLFDVTVGARTWGDDADAPLRGVLEVDPERPAVHCRKLGRQIDLGGIGKGFALGECRPILESHGVPEALLSAGASTHLSWGETPWTIQNGAGSEHAVVLKGDAWSVSGEAIQGAHVIHPGGDKSNPNVFGRVGVKHRDPALADAFSTAALLMDRTELAWFASTLEPGGRVLAWPRDGGAVLDYPGQMP